MEKYGVENLSKIAVNLGKTGTVVCRLINKAGIIALFDLISVVNDFKTINFPSAKDELLDLSADEQRKLDQDLKDNFNPGEQMVSVEVKFDAFLGQMEKTRDIVDKSVADGKEVYENVKELVESWKSFFA